VLAHWRPLYCRQGDWLLTRRRSACAAWWLPPAAAQGGVRNFSRRHCDGNGSGRTQRSGILVGTRLPLRNLFDNLDGGRYLDEFSRCFPSVSLPEVLEIKKPKRKGSRLTSKSSDQEIIRWTESHDVFDRLEQGVSEVVEDHSDLDEFLREAIFQDNTAQLNMRLLPAMKAVLSSLPVSARWMRRPSLEFGSRNGWNELKAG
jgi:hypothetical protein